MMFGIKNPQKKVIFLSPVKEKAVREYIPNHIEVATAKCGNRYMKEPSTKRNQKAKL